MPKTEIRYDFELTTRNAYTKVEAELSLNLNGRELPTMAVVGEAMEQAAKTIQEAITASYETVPARV